MEINLTNYNHVFNYNKYILKFHDYVTFSVENTDYKYLVLDTHLKGINISNDNDSIFKILQINKYDFCERYYRYKSDFGAFPVCKNKDYKALTRLVIALFNMCAIKADPDQLIQKEPKKEFIVYGDIAEHTINKNNLNLISNGKTIKTKGNPSCISRGKQKRRSGICCKAVTATIRVGHLSNRKIYYGEEEDEE